MKNMICTGQFHVQWDEGAYLSAVSRDGFEFVPPVDCTYYKINAQGVEWELAEYEEKRMLFKPVQISEERAAAIRSVEVLPRVPGDIRLSVSEMDGEVVLQTGIQEDGTGKFDTMNPERLQPLHAETNKEPWISMTFSVPDTAVIHLAEHKNAGHLLDGDMKEEHVYECRLEYNLLIVEMPGLSIRFRTKDENLKSAGASIRRHRDTFSVTFSWRAGSAALLGFFNNYTGAAEDFRLRVEREKGLRRLRDRRDVPQWIHGIRLVLHIDMMRSNWTVFHDFRDVINIAGDVKNHISPENVLFYLAGWQGAYDGCQPAYIPDMELGGEAGFKEMADQLHAWGFRIMLHTCVYGVDPYAGEVEEWENRSLTRNGKITGWQICRERPDRMVSFDYRSRRISLGNYRKMEKFKVPFGYISGDCFPYMTVGGVSGKKGRIRLSQGRRRIISPTGWFEVHDLYDYPYPLHFETGQMEVEVEISEDADLDLENAWLQIRDSMTYSNPYSTWTYPMLHGSGYNEEYVKTAADNIAHIVRKYGIDAVHMDAGSFYPEGDKGTVLAVKKALPEGTLMGCEYYTTWEEADFWMLSQGACQDLVLEKFPDVCIKEQASLPMLEGLHEFFDWMDKTSPVCDFIKDYLYFYPHLVAANAFVATSKVSNIAPERKIPYDDGEHWRVLRNAGRLGYINGLRLNYRKYGLDPGAIEALHELALQRSNPYDMEI